MQKSGSDNNSSVIEKVYAMTFDDDKNTLLHFAAADGDTTEVIKLIQEGHKVNPENYLGWTPLMVAAGNGHLETVENLLQNRADATKKNKFGMSTFNISIASGNLDLIKVILKHLLCGGVSKKHMESYISPISVAVQYKYTEIFNFLLEQFFDVNMAEPVTGITPIMYAAVEGITKFYNILVSNGADQYTKNAINQSALDIIHTHPNLIYPQIQSPHHNSQQTVMNNYVYHYPHVRTSSNVESQHHVLSPSVSPITPIGPVMYAPIQGMNQFYNTLVSTGLDQYPKYDSNTSIHSHPNVIHSQTQCPQHSSQQIVLINPYNYLHTRKSSNTESPHNVIPPNVSPITPIGNVPHIVFSCTDNPGPYIHPPVSPSTPIYGNEFLNAHVNSQYYSPIPQFIFPSPATGYSVNWVANSQSPS